MGASPKWLEPMGSELTKIILTAQSAMLYYKSIIMTESKKDIRFIVCQINDCAVLVNLADVRLILMKLPKKHKANGTKKY